MQGLEISKKYYLEFGKEMLEKEFAEVKDRIAVGLVGEGSECLGFDDEISRDHDFEPGFCLWLTEEDEAKFGFKLFRAYSKLPKEFMGLKRSILSPVGGNRHGVITIEEFYTRFLGSPTAPESLEQWLYIPSCSLLSASNGEVFEDNLGVFSAIRNQIINGYPEDIRRKKLAGHTAFMAQAGQYNYARCLSRGEKGSAQLAVYDFVKNAISTIYLLNNAYEPFYKWAYRGLKKLPILGDLGETLQSLTETDNTPENVKIKVDKIEMVCSLLIAEFKRQNLTKAVCDDMEKHAYSILDGIKDGKIRNMHVMQGV